MRIKNENIDGRSSVTENFQRSIQALFKRTIDKAVEDSTPTDSLQDKSVSREPSTMTSNLPAIIDKNSKRKLAMAKNSEEEATVEVIKSSVDSVQTYGKGSIWGSSSIEELNENQEVNSFYHDASERLVDGLTCLSHCSDDYGFCFSGLDWSACPPLQGLADALILNEDEKQLLLLCFLFFCDERLAIMAKDLSHQGKITLSLASRLLNGGRLMTLSSESPLRLWRIVHLDNQATVHSSELVLDEHCVFYLLEQPSLHLGLCQLLTPVRPTQRFLESQRTPALHLWKLILQSRRKTNGRPSQIMLCANGSLRGGGTARSGNFYDSGNQSDINIAAEVICFQVAHQLKGQLFKLQAKYLPTTLKELNDLAILMQRQHLLHNSFFFIDTEKSNRRHLSYFLQRLTQPPMSHFHSINGVKNLPNFCFIIGVIPEDFDRDRVIVTSICDLSAEEKAHLWKQSLAQKGWNFDELDLLTIVKEFSFSLRTISSVVSHLTAEIVPNAPSLGGGNDDSKTQPNLAELWEACRQQSQSLINYPT